MNTKRIITKRNEQGKILEYEYHVNGVKVPDGYKYCPSCSSVLELSLFTRAGKACAECAKKKSREHHHNRMQSPEYREQRRKQHRDKCRNTKQQIINHYGNKCLDCKTSYPAACYDVHHLDPSTKEFNVSNNRIFDEKLKEELTKCVLLCANCHRIRHFEGGNL